jgi:hypothetical protein
VGQGATPRHRRLGRRQRKLLEDEEIRQALAIRLTDALFERTDLVGVLEARLPAPLDRLAAPIARLIETQAPTAADQLLQSPPTQALWTRINREVHTRLVALLEDETEFVSLYGTNAFSICGRSASGWRLESGCPSASLQAPRRLPSCAPTSSRPPSGQFE